MLRGDCLDRGWFAARYLNLDTFVGNYINGEIFMNQKLHDLSPYFSKKEFFCKCGCGGHPVFTDERFLKLLLGLENLRRDCKKKNIHFFWVSLCAA